MIGWGLIVITLIILNSAMAFALLSYQKRKVVSARKEKELREELNALLLDRAYSVIYLDFLTSYIPIGKERPMTKDEAMDYLEKTHKADNKRIEQIRTMLQHE